MITHTVRLLNNNNNNNKKDLTIFKNHDHYYYYIIINFLNYFYSVGSIRKTKCRPNLHPTDI